VRRNSIFSVVPGAISIPGCRSRASVWILAALALASLLCTVQAQTAKPAATAHRVAKAHKRAAKPEAAAAAQPVAAQPEAPPQPETPKWPANERPTPAQVSWDAAGLRIDAQNSSLEQILREVSTATGAKVEGFSSDQRVFGIYGPGKARDVLSEILTGAGYNVLMYGELGMGAPRQIVLASRNKGGGEAQPEAQSDPDGGGGDAGDEDEVVEEQPAQPPQPALRPGFGPGGQPRTPQQIMQEMQQRQQQMQQQLQQQQQQQ
jgi:hypothetical protein